MRRVKKDKINILMNIDNYFGKYEGNGARTIAFLVVVATPFLLYVFLFMSYIPIRWIIIPEILWGLRMALYILGREPQKVAAYKKELDDRKAEELAMKGEGDASALSKDDASDILRSSHIHEDGLIEYPNGSVCYILSGFVKRFDSDATFSYHLEEFFQEISRYRYTYDIHLHMVINEDRLYDNPEQFKVYKDKELLTERVDFYRSQDEYCNTHSTLFRYNIPVRASKYAWKEMRGRLEELVDTVIAKELFYSLKICNRDEVSEVASRDIGTHLDIDKMLQEKYSNTEYYGAKVLYYGDEIPEDMKEKKDTVNLKARRVQHFNKEG